MAEPHEDIYLVLRLDKVLQGADDEATEEYFKSDMKHFAKNELKAQEYCARLCTSLLLCAICFCSAYIILCNIASYRQLLGYGVTPVFGKDSKEPILGPGGIQDLFHPRDNTVEALMEIIWEMKVPYPCFGLLLCFCCC